MPNFGTVPNSTIKSLKDAKLIPITQIHDRSLSCFGTDTSIIRKKKQ